MFTVFQNAGAVKSLGWKRYDSSAWMLSADDIEVAFAATDYGSYAIVVPSAASASGYHVAARSPA